MEQNLNTDILHELLNIGFAHAADALSMILFEGVLMQQLDFSGDVSKMRASNPEGNMIVLKTSLMGDLSGVSYLYFSEQQAKMIFDRCLPPWDGTNKEARVEMEKAILLEIDNMVAASVVTKLSNLLGVTLYGDVPHISVYTSSDFDTFLKQEQDKYPALSAYSFFRPLKLQNFQPGFTWFFGKDFTDKVAELANSEKHMSLISK